MAFCRVSCDRNDGFRCVFGAEIYSHRFWDSLHRRKGEGPRVLDGRELLVHVSKWKGHE